jgi:hypothetical protein
LESNLLNFSFDFGQDRFRLCFSNPFSISASTKVCATGSAICSRSKASSGNFCIRFSSNPSYCLYSTSKFEFSANHSITACRNNVDSTFTRIIVLSIFSLVSAASFHFVQLSQLFMALVYMIHLFECMHCMVTRFPGDILGIGFCWHLYQRT